MARSAIPLWLRAMNPFVAPRGMAEAQRSARATVIGLAVSLVLGGVATVWMMQNPGWLTTTLAAEYARAGLSADEIAMQEAFMAFLRPAAMWVALIFSLVLYAVLAWVQWRHMTRAVPILLLALIAYSLLSNVVVRLVGTLAIPEIPVWLLIVTWSSSAVCAAIYAASLRGAIMLHQLKGQP